MKSLFFVFGILFAQYILPLLDGIGALALTFMETKKAKFSEEINNTNIRMKKAMDPEETPKHPIGFSVSIEKDIEEEDEEDDV